MIDLRLGDCLEILPTLAAGSVDAVVTDPPYGIDFDYGDKYQDKSELYSEMMHQFITEANRLVSDGPVFVWQAMLNCDKWHEWFAPGYRIFAACKGFVQYRPTPIQFSWDPVIFWGKGRNDPSVYSKDYHEQRKAPFGKNRERIEHPCPRPYEQVEYVIRLATRPGDTILDPFMGSGTTGVACVQTGRNFIGIEIDPGYFEIAKKRIEQERLQSRIIIPNIISDKNNSNKGNQTTLF